LPVRRDPSLGPVARGLVSLSDQRAPTSPGASHFQWVLEPGGPRTTAPLESSAIKLRAIASETAASGHRGCSVASAGQANWVQFGAFLRRLLNLRRQSLLCLQARRRR
jgi:hypothetical protein